MAQMILPILTLPRVNVVKKQHPYFFSETRVNVFNIKRNLLSNQRLQHNTKPFLFRSVANGQHHYPNKQLAIVL
jgi:hypothetical protein